MDNWASRPATKVYEQTILAAYPVATLTVAGGAIHSHAAAVAAIRPNATSRRLATSTLDLNSFSFMALKANHCSARLSGLDKYQV
jgi:hypothetical protein